MPQMAPMMWLNLFVIFSCTFLVFLIMNYFSKTLGKADMLAKPLHNSSLIWKW